MTSLRFPIFEFDQKSCSWKYPILPISLPSLRNLGTCVCCKKRILKTRGSERNS
ncbi:hypothetical protein SLEP1_g46044 [Rubroshorea leprosula]|uniref:Uncharacterized protein n=1 Tax=Rubroshorea leprosula TaxID=152421 RepID=A0AAV5LLQ0_9ROSI|nr:hypothetical protein SLEP1_g46044 [Rubroshorea leprosula]